MKKILLIKNCLGCFNLFDTKPWKKASYCSHSCWLKHNGFQKDNILTLGYKHSQKSLEKISKASRGNNYALGYHHTDTAKSNMTLHRSGKNHWNWRTDREELKKSTQRYTAAYIEWRNKVVERDNAKCRINNEKCVGGFLEVHHILPWKDFPEERYNINNGITLCHEHHPRKKVDVKNMTLVLQKLAIEKNASI